MAWTQLKNAINNAIKANNNQEITGPVLNSVLNSIVNSMGKYATFAGVATPSTNPGVFEGPVIYFANIAGTYPNFDNITVGTNKIVALYNINGVWDSYEIGDNNITTSRIADKAVTSEKLADSAMSQAMTDAIAAETARAKAAEETNAAAIAEEEEARSLAVSQEAQARAKNDESLNNTIVAETARAKAAEEANATSIIGTDRIADGAVRTNNIAQEAVTGDKIATGTITEDNIQDKSLSQNALADDAVNTAIIQDGAVTTEKLADSAMSQAMTDAIVAETARAKAAEEANAAAIAAETTRAKAAEKANADNIAKNAQAIEAVAAENKEQTKKLSELDAKKGYYVCNSLENDSEKTITIPKFILDSTIRIIIRFTYANSVEEVYLNINNTGSKRLYVGDKNTWKAGSLIDIVYDGTNYQGTFYKTNTASEISFNSNDIKGHNLEDALKDLNSKINSINLTTDNIKDTESDRTQKEINSEITKNIKNARDFVYIQGGLQFYPSENKVSTIGAGGYIFTNGGILGSKPIENMDLTLPNKTSIYIIYTDSSLQLKYINAVYELPLGALTLAITGVSNDKYVLYVASSTYYIDGVQQNYVLKNDFDKNLIKISSELSKLNYSFDFGSNLMFGTYIAKNNAIIIPGTIQFNPNYAGGVTTSMIPIDSSVSYNYKGNKPFAGYIINDAGEKIGYSGDFKTYPENTSYVVLSFLTQDLYKSFILFKETEESNARNKILFSSYIDILGSYGISLKGNDTLSVIGNGANVTWQNLGDSMSANDNLNEEGTDYLYNGKTQYQQQGWGRRTCQLLGINYNAVGGNFHNIGKSGWSSIQLANSLETLQMLKPNCDIYSIFLCTNDWGNNTGNITFGTLDDYKNYTYDGDTINNTAKALKRIVDYIFSIQTEKNKTPYILFITPPRRGAWGYKYKSDNSVLYIPGDYEAIHGQYLEDVVNLIKDISEYEGFGCIDLFHNSIVPARLLSHMTKEELEAQDASQGNVPTDIKQDILIDNLHQTGKGYNIIAQRVAMNLMSNTNFFQKTIVF